MKTKNKKAKKIVKPSYRTLEKQLRQVRTSALDAVMGGHDKDAKIATLNGTVTELEKQLNAERERFLGLCSDMGLYFAAASNPVTAKDAARMAALQAKMFSGPEKKYVTWGVPTWHEGVSGNYAISASSLKV